jgi:hypothetical protein
MRCRAVTQNIVLETKAMSHYAGLPDCILRHGGYSAEVRQSELVKIKPSCAKATEGILHRRRFSCGRESLATDEWPCHPKPDRAKDGGGGGIRTPGGLAPTSDFKSGAFNHSATPPKPMVQVENLPVQVNGADGSLIEIGDRTTAILTLHVIQSPHLPS